jgi:hypothetical protein
VIGVLTSVVGVLLCGVIVRMFLEEGSAIWPRRAPRTLRAG